MESAASDALDRLERTTTANDVTAILRRRILKGQYPEDEFIRQEVIATELGVSRIPVREALAQLEAEGLVIRVKYRGAIVPKLSLREIGEIYEMRRMIEPYLLRNAIENISEDQIGRLQQLVDRSRKTDDIPSWATLNIEFHRTLFEAAERPIALSVLDNLLVRADRYLKMQNFNSSSTKEESDAQHQKILDLIIARDTQSAILALEDHIGWNAEDVRSSIELPKLVPQAATTRSAKTAAKSRT